jgi:hypothetical protein
LPTIITTIITVGVTIIITITGGIITTTITTNQTANRAISSTSNLRPAAAKRLQPGLFALERNRFLLKRSSL